MPANSLGRRAGGLLLAVLLPLPAPAQPAQPRTVVACRAPADPQRREWRLQRAGSDEAPQWSIGFSSAALDRPSVSLPLPNARPAIDEGSVTLSFHTSNGGRSVELVAERLGESSLELSVNHGLEVNIERDLDPAVERMNTDGPIEVECEWPGAQEVGKPEGLPPQGLPPQGLPPLASEWMVGAGLAWSVPLYDGEGGRRYVWQTVSWGRELTRGGGPGLLRGRFVWAIELAPVYGQFAPTRAYGVGVSPLYWRWNFDPRGRWAPFAELSMGGLWTSSPVPEGTSAANFTAHAGLGARIRASDHLAWVAGFRFQHISNGNLEVENPGVNAPMVWGGLSFR